MFYIVISLNFWDNFRVKQNTIELKTPINLKILFEFKKAVKIVQILIHASKIVDYRKKKVNFFKESKKTNEF